MTDEQRKALADALAYGTGIVGVDRKDFYATEDEIEIRRLDPPSPEAWLEAINSDLSGYSFYSMEEMTKEEFERKYPRMS